jgi:hypothetical protein
MGKNYNSSRLVNGLSVDASGNVAIGIATPTTRLTIGRVDSSSEGGQIDLCRASDNTNAWGIDVFGNTTTPSLRFVDNVASAARMVITGAGNVGIGTTTPNANGLSTALTINGTSTSGLEINANGVNQGYLIASTSLMILNARTSIPLLFYTADTERMRITSTGNVIIGGTGATSNAALTIRPVNGSTQATISMVANNTSGSNPSLYMECPGVVGGGMYIDRNTSTLRVWQAGDTNGVQLTNNATSWGSFSDVRLKTDLQEINDAVSKINSIRAVTGRYKTDEVGISRSFVIAQDVQKVFPEAVDVLQDEIGTLSLRYTDLIPVLVKAIQELNQQVQDQQQTINSLINR